MKFILIALLSMGISASAFSACGVTSPAECAAEAECMALNPTGTATGPKFSFDANRPVKCMTVDSAALSNCEQVAATKRDPSVKVTPVAIDPKTGKPVSTK